MTIQEKKQALQERVDALEGKKDFVNHVRQTAESFLTEETILRFGFGLKDVTVGHRISEGNEGMYQELLKDFNQKASTIMMQEADIHEAPLQAEQDAIIAESEAIKAEEDAEKQAQAEQAEQDRLFMLETQAKELARLQFESQSVVPTDKVAESNG